MRKSPCLVLPLTPLPTWRRTGGHKEFHKRHKDLCEDTLLPTTTSTTTGICNSNNNNNNSCSNNSKNNNNDSDNIERPPVSAKLLKQKVDDNNISETILAEEDLDKHPVSRVLPHLYLGNATDAANLDCLRRLGISRVLNVTSQIPGYHEKSGITYKQLPANDSGHQNLKQYFEQAFDFIEEARKTNAIVLVHCQAGISRSPTIVIAYIMKHRQLSMVEAYKLVKKARSIISPNLNFMGQLLELEQGLRCTSGSGQNSPSVSDCKPREYRWSLQPNDELSSSCSV